MTDVESVGGKNASLGEMISNLPTGVKVPTGFATTAHAFREFLQFDGLGEKINAKLQRWTPKTCARWRRSVPKFAPGRGAALSRGLGARHSGCFAKF
jgi:phosphoenolpyruvate synthase/pyruvate phosphate dikinase